MCSVWQLGILLTAGILDAQMKMSITVKSAVALYGDLKTIFKLHSSSYMIPIHSSERKNKAEISYISLFRKA